jgi:hypothetical protein
MQEFSEHCMQSLFDPLHQETAVPIAQRFLMLEGTFDASWIKERIHQRMPAAIAQYHARLTADWHEAITAYQHTSVRDTSVYCAVAFAYAQLPVGKTFEVLFPAYQPAAAVQSPAVLVAVINEWIPLPMPYIEAGHRSICLFDFPAGVPGLIQSLATVERFMQRPIREQVWLAASEETVQHLLQARNTGKDSAGCVM